MSGASQTAPSVGAGVDLSVHAALLGWHAEWLRKFAEDQAAATYLEMTVERRCSGADELLCTKQQIWESAATDVAQNIYFAVEPVADADFATQAQLFGIEVFLRRLFELLRTSGPGGRA